MRSTCARSRASCSAQPGVVTILLADMEPIARSAGARYAESMPSDVPVDPEEIGRRYLAKIVQLEVALPPPVPDDMRRVIREYGPSLRHATPAAAAESPEAPRAAGSTAWWSGSAGGPWSLARRA